MFFLRTMYAFLSIFRKAKTEKYRKYNNKEYVKSMTIKS